VTPASPSGRSKRSKAQAATFLEIVRLSEELQRGFTELFKAHDMSPALYNVLRVLRGAGDAGLTCGDVAGRLVQHDPDVTRLLDRLERRGLIERRRSVEDRRVVRTRITEAGLTLLDQLDGPVDALHERQLGHVPEARLKDLLSIVEEARAKPG
jgi:DNA-binding MarR family transcriptional regulator